MDCAGANVPKRMKIYKMEQHVQNRTRKEKSELEIKRTMRKKNGVKQQQEDEYNSIRFERK